MNKLAVLIGVSVMILFLAACTQQQLPTSGPEIQVELQEEPETALPAELPELAEAVPAEEEEEQPEEAPATATPPKEKPALAPEHTTPNSVIVSQKTVIGRAGDTDKKEEPVSWFSDVVCGKLFPDGDSLIRFTFENKGTKTYYLTKVNVEELTEKDGINIRLNSDRVSDNPKKECGAEMVKPGQKVTCTVKEKLRKGMTYWEKELVNKLAASTVGLYSELKFTCEGIAE